MAAILGWTNYVTMTGTALTAGAALASMPPQNLVNPLGSPSVAWQTPAGVVTAGGGALLTVDPAASAVTWRAAGLFRSNLTPQASVVFTLYSGGVSVWTATVAGPASGFGQVVAVLPSDTMGDYLTIGINDAGNPDGHINVPLAFAGPVWIPATNPAWSSTIGRDDGTDVVVSRGGQEAVSPLWQRRRWELALDGVRATEVWADVDALRMTARLGGNVLFAPDLASEYLSQEAVFGRLQETADISYPYQMADRRAWRAKITERL